MRKMNAFHIILGKYLMTRRRVIINHFEYPFEISKLTKEKERKGEES